MSHCFSPDHNKYTLLTQAWTCHKPAKPDYMRLYVNPAYPLPLSPFMDCVDSLSVIISIDLQQYIHDIHAYLAEKPEKIL